jgi:hypothetical protein
MAERLESMVMKKPKTEEVVKTTVRLRRDIWLAARGRALEQRIDFQDLVAAAIELYLRTQRKEGGR